jgi:hypothetical protein
MAPLPTLAGVLGLAVTSGINLYLSVLVTGLALRFHWVSGLPKELDLLAHPAVLTVAGLLYLLEFLADKVPFLTPVWDAVHTAIRPVGGALLALGAAGDLHPLARSLALLAGGTLALGTHGTKMGLRLAAHAAPEPGTHAALSVAEDLGVVGLLVLVYTHPKVALAVLAALLLLMAWLAPLVLRTLRFMGAVLRDRLDAGLPPDPPDWVEERLLALGADAPQPAYARTVRGVPRLKRGWLVRTGARWHFLYRRWGRVRSLDFDEGRLEPLRRRPGFLYDTLVLAGGGRPHRFYLTKGAGTGPS